MAFANDVCVWRGTKMHSLSTSAESGDAWHIKADSFEG